jgi:hypothetical protein
MRREHHEQPAGLLIMLEFNRLFSDEERAFFKALE